MNVLEVVCGYFPHHRAGVPQHIRSLITRLVADGDFSATIVAQETEDFVGDGIRQVRLPRYPLRWWKHKRNWFYRWFDGTILWCGPRICREQKIDLIHGHTWQYGGRQAILLGRRCKLPVVVTLHGTILDDYSANTPPEWFEMLLEAAHLVVQKPSARDKLISWGYPPEKITLSLGPVSEKFHAPPPRTYQAPLRLLFAGRFDPIKRPMLLVEMARMIQERHLPITITAVGNGVLLHEVTAAVQRQSLEGILQLPGWVDDMAACYREHDLILGLSDKHNVSDLALLEGMTCAMVPLVTSSLDIQYLVQHNRNGLIAGTSARELVDCMSRISPEELPRLARAAEESARSAASLEHVAEQHRSIFHEISAK